MNTNPCFVARRDTQMLDNHRPICRNTQTAVNLLAPNTYPLIPAPLTSASTSTHAFFPPTVIAHRWIPAHPLCPQVAALHEALQCVSRTARSRPVCFASRRAWRQAYFPEASAESTVPIPGVAEILPDSLAQAISSGAASVSRRRMGITAS